MFRYQLVTTEGVELGDAVYSVGIKPGETVHVGGCQRLRVLDVVFDDEGSDYVEMLKVEEAEPGRPGRGRRALASVRPPRRCPRSSGCRRLTRTAPLQGIYVAIHTRHRESRIATVDYHLLKYIVGLFVAFVVFARFYLRNT